MRRLASLRYPANPTTATASTPASGIVLTDEFTHALVILEQGGQFVRARPDWTQPSTLRTDTERWGDGLRRTVGQRTAAHRGAAGDGGP